MSIKATAITSGQSSPATIAEGRGWYKFKKDPNWPEDRSAYTEAPQPGVAPEGLKGSKERKQERLERFGAALRDLGHDPWTAPPKAVREAGMQAGIGYDTAREYRNEMKRQSVRDGEVSDG